MAEAQRRAEVVWSGGLARGEGTVSLGSGALEPARVTWASRTLRSEGMTSPEELIAAAHAACFSMQLAHILEQNGTPPARMQTSATVTFAEGDSGWRVASSALEVVASVEGDIDEARLAELAAEARDGCPVSGALKDNVEIAVQSRLLTRPRDTP
jgi:osmotically inducible protein OsmC